MQRVKSHLDCAGKPDNRALELNKEYYDAINEMQKHRVAKAYMHGWSGGFLGNPKLEEQRLTEAYQAGYADGANRVTDNFQAWVQSE